MKSKFGAQQCHVKYKKTPILVLQPSLPPLKEPLQLVWPTMKINTTSLVLTEFFRLPFFQIIVLMVGRIDIYQCIFFDYWYNRPGRRPNHHLRLPRDFGLVGPWWSGRGLRAEPSHRVATRPTNIYLIYALLNKLQFTETRHGRWCAQLSSEARGATYMCPCL